MAKNGFSMSNRIAVEEITATKTLTVNDCGKHFSVDTAAGAIVVTLPAIAAAEDGWNATFHVVSGSSTRANFTVSSPAADVNMRAVVLAGTAEGSATTSAVTFDAGQYSINSNATNWSLTESLLQPDVMQSGTLDVGDVNNFGSVISTDAGVGTNFDVDITSAHTIENLDSGGAGSVTTGSFVTSVTTQ